MGKLEDFQNSPEGKHKHKLEAKLRSMTKEQILEVLTKHNIRVLDPENATHIGIVMIPIFDIPHLELEKTLENY